MNYIQLFESLLPLLEKILATLAQHQIPATHLSEAEDALVHMRELLAQHKASVVQAAVPQPATPAGK